MNRNTLMLIAGSLLLAVALWYLFLRDQQPASLLQTEDLTATNAIEGDVVAVLLQLRAVSLSGTIFSDPVFQSLKDFGTPVVPESVGRPNPFAPIGVNTASGATTTAPKSAR